MPTYVRVKGWKTGRRQAVLKLQEITGDNAAMIDEDQKSRFAKVDQVRRLCGKCQSRTDQFKSVPFECATCEQLVLVASGKD